MLISVTFKLRIIFDVHGPSRAIRARNTPCNDLGNGPRLLRVCHRVPWQPSGDPTDLPASSCDLPGRESKRVISTVSCLGLPVPDIQPFWETCTLVFGVGEELVPAKLVQTLAM